MLTNLYKQLNQHLTAAVTLYFFAFSLLLMVYIAGRFVGIPPANLLRDTSSLAEVAPWIGLVSNVGALLWCAAVTVCFAGTAVATQQNDLLNRRFFLASGLLTAFLLVDDFFVLHESFRDYLGFPEKAFYAFYLIFFSLYFVKYGRYILKTDFLFLALGLAFLGASFGLDNIQEIIINYAPIDYYLLEDGLKLLGIVNWFGFFAIHFNHQIRRIPTPQPTD
ncbi:MAG: hypothetical protein WAS33_04700 [Candidatus Promineifilaceae bacterium]|nr:hypothetical protein [Anaerolineaceae bacterium]